VLAIGEIDVALTNKANERLIHQPGCLQGMKSQPSSATFSPLGRCSSQREASANDLSPIMHNRYL
jgi:hypothetical protein